MKESTNSKSPQSLPLYLSNQAFHKRCKPLTFVKEVIKILLLNLKGIHRAEERGKLSSRDCMVLSQLGLVII